MSVVMFGPFGERRPPQWVEHIPRQIVMEWSLRLAGIWG